MIMLGLLVLFGVPCAFAVWLGTRIRWPLLAFLLAWVTTPLASYGMIVALWPILAAMTPPNNDGTWVIMVPLYSIATGLLAGIAAAVVVTRRRNKEGTAPVAPGQARATAAAEPVASPAEPGD